MQTKHDKYIEYTQTVLKKTNVKTRENKKRKRNNKFKNSIVNTNATQRNHMLKHDRRLRTLGAYTT